MSEPAEHMDAATVNDDLDFVQAAGMHKACITVLNQIELGLAKRTIMWQLLRGMDQSCKLSNLRLISLDPS